MPFDCMDLTAAMTMLASLFAYVGVRLSYDSRFLPPSVVLWQACFVNKPTCLLYACFPLSLCHYGGLKLTSSVRGGLRKFTAIFYDYYETLLCTLRFPRSTVESASFMTWAGATKQYRKNSTTPFDKSKLQLRIHILHPRNAKTFDAVAASHANSYRMGGILQGQQAYALGSHP